MKFINVTPNPSGAYPGPHKAPFPGCLPLTDGQAETLVEMCIRDRIRPGRPANWPGPGPPPTKGRF